VAERYLEFMWQFACDGFDSDDLRQGKNRRSPRTRLIVQMKTV
jgi:hypothetical protein